jgi:hypothetical protein
MSTGRLPSGPVSSASPRQPTIHREASNHAPLTPSPLSHSFAPGTPPDDVRTSTPPAGGGIHSADEDGRAEASGAVEHDPAGGRASHENGNASEQNNAGTAATGRLHEPRPHGVDIRRRLMEAYNRSPPKCGDPECDHGTYSPRPWSPMTPMSFDSQNNTGGPYPEAGGEGSSSSSDEHEDTLELLGEERRRRKLNTTQWLVKRHGIKNTRRMCVPFPNLLPNMLAGMEVVDFCS